jgi:hypothetical protein
MLALFAPEAAMADSLPPGLTAEAVQSATIPEQHRAIADAYGMRCVAYSDGAHDGVCSDVDHR